MGIAEPCILDTHPGQGSNYNSGLQPYRLCKRRSGLFEIPLPAVSPGQIKIGSHNRALAAPRSLQQINRLINPAQQKLRVPNSESEIARLGSSGANPDRVFKRRNAGPRLPQIQ